MVREEARGRGNEIEVGDSVLGARFDLVLYERWRRARFYMEEAGQRVGRLFVVERGKGWPQDAVWSRSDGH